MTSDEVFEAISHPIRIAILRELAKRPTRFADLKRNLKIKSGGQLDFHLKNMEAVITIDKDGLYTLNAQRFAALRAVHVVSNYGWQRKSWMINLFHDGYTQLLLLSVGILHPRSNSNNRMDSLLQLLDICEKKSSSKRLQRKFR